MGLTNLFPRNRHNDLAEAKNLAEVKISAGLPLLFIEAIREKSSKSDIA